MAAPNTWPSQQQRAGLPRWLLLAQTATLTLALISITMFVAGIPLDYRHIYNDCLYSYSQSCPTPAFGEEPLLALGLSRQFYALYHSGVYALTGVVYIITAALIFLRRPREPMALFAAATLIGFGPATWSTSPGALTGVLPLLGSLLGLLQTVGMFAFALFLLLFPNGRMVAPKASWTALTVLCLHAGLVIIPPDSSPLQFKNLPPLFKVLPLGIWMGLLIAIQVYRYRKCSGTVERKQTKWVVFGLVATLVGFLSFSAIPVILIDPHFHDSGGPVRSFIVNGGLNLSVMLWPIALSVAILKHRLWDIDPIINRTLVYGALSAIVIGLYVLVVSYLGALLGEGKSLLISLVATGVVAVLFQPLRDRLQRAVNRLLYGERDDPYAVLAGLGRRLGSAISPESVLPTVVRTVRDSLRLPYAAVALRGEEGFTVAAESGEPQGELHRLPLRHTGEEVGQLLLAPRSPGEPFDPADQRLLDDLARQAGAAVHGVRLNLDLQRVTEDLQRSRERLILAREEERRRLRRDLHDDLAPKLAALALTTAAAEDLIPGDRAGAARLLAELRTAIRETVGDIRRLVYDLRPPTLDNLGLVAAVRERAAQYTSPTRGMGGARLDVRVDAPDQLPPLPAAVEVAAYRIIQEALMNVFKHAEARQCQIRIAAAPVAGQEGLELTVLDDGKGLPAPGPGGAQRVGVGLRSMRERASELGGQCVIERSPRGGTQVRAWLPIVQGTAPETTHPD